MRVLSPKSGDVLEQGAEVTLSADVGIERAGEAFVVSIADGRSWSGRWWRVVAERVRAGADGEVRLRYRVPRDLAASDAYVVKFAALDAGGAKHAPSAEVSGVKVSTPLKIKRLGRDEVVVEWSPSALPTDASARDGWRLAVDVVPCVAASETETQAMVVGELFLQAATDGLTVHTRRSSVLFDVNRDEAAKRRKRLRLTADRSYRVALAGFTVGELEPVFGTARVECRMRLVQLRAVGGGYNTPAAGARRVALGDAERRRPPAWGGQVQTKAAAGKTKGERQTRGGGDTSSNPAAAESTTAEGGGGGGALEGAAEAPGAADDKSGGGFPEEGRGRPTFTSTFTSLSSAAPPPGSWEVDQRGAGPFGGERGVNVTVVRASDLETVFDETFDVSGGRRSAEASAACAALRALFEGPGNHDEKNARTSRTPKSSGGSSGSSTPSSAAPPGLMLANSPARLAWGSHFCVVTSAGAWAMAPGKDGDDRGVSAALAAVVRALGGSPAAVAVATEACAGKIPGQPGGFALVAACGPGGDARASRVWVKAGANAKEAATVTLTLARDEREWFPALVRGGRGDAQGDWFAPWDRWGGEPWGGIPAYAAEEARVDRHARVLNDLRAAFLGKPDAFSGTGEDGFARGGQSGEPASASEALYEDDGAGGSKKSRLLSEERRGARVETHGVAKALVAYATAKFSAAGWCAMGDLRRAYRTMTDEEVALTRSAEAFLTGVAKTRRAFSAAELVAAGAGEYLARRLASLVDEDGGLVEKKALGDDEAAPDDDAEKKSRSAEARQLATALASLGARNGAASLAEMTRRGVALDAIPRALLASWRGTLGEKPCPEIELCAEELACADVAAAEVAFYHAPTGGEGERKEKRPVALASALRAGLTYLPGAETRPVAGLVRVLEVRAPDPKRPTAPIDLPDAAPPAADFFPSEDFGGEDGDASDGDSSGGSVEPWGGSDTGSDVVMTTDELSGGGDAGAHAAVRSAAKKLIRDDPRAQGNDKKNPAAPGGSPPAPSSAPPVSLAGCFVMFKAKDHDWRAFEAMTRQAPRLTHLAAAAGAVAVAFLWPEREPKYPPAQCLCASPNFDVPVGIPAFVLPHAFFSVVCRDKDSAGDEEPEIGGDLMTAVNGRWEARVGARAAGDGAAARLAARCGDALRDACAARPEPGTSDAAARWLARGGGRLAGLKGLEARRKAREEADEGGTRPSSREKGDEKKAAAAAAAAATAAEKGDEKAGEAGGEGWTWTKYFGIGGGTKDDGAAAEGAEAKVPETAAAAEEDPERRNPVAEDDADDSVAEDADSDSATADSGPSGAEDSASDPSPSPSSPSSSFVPLSPAESARARRWSAAMRVASAMGDFGRPILDAAYPPPDASRPGSVRVLCLDGGGIRGLATIVMLERIMLATGAWCVGECFDLVVGTSTGGVIALGAGLLRLTLGEVGELYDAMASEVFKPDGYYELLRRGPGHAAARSFERVMGDVLGPEADQPLYAAAAHERWYAAGDDARPGGPPRVCLVTSLASRQPSTPFLLRSYKRGGSTYVLDGGGRRRNASAAGVGELPSEHRAGAVHALRATTAAPWYMEELTLEKELGLGRLRARAGEKDEAASAARDEDDGEEESESNAFYDGNRSEGGFGFGGGSPGFYHLTPDADASRTSSTLRFIDGAIACNNPTAVGIFEARRLYGRDRALVVVSLGTGAAIPCETETDYRDPGNVSSNLVGATCDVLQVDAIVRHVLGEGDRYFRFQPTDRVFSCNLADSREETRKALREAARAYMDTEGARAEVDALAKCLKQKP